jgi:RNA polymerase sigma-70 factor (ECF subfamily)
MATVTEPTHIAGAEARDARVDVDLVARMQSGDERALGAFYDRWFPVVHAVVSRMLKSSDDVEDVVEDTFWQVWRQAGRFAGERGSVQTWVLTIARSRALDRLRAVRRHREEPIEAEHVDDVTATMADPVAAPPRDPSIEVEHSERRGHVLAALGALPNEQRQALELAYFGGLSQSEIAERTGQPLGTIKTRMRLALQKLRERLSSLAEDMR